MKSFEIPPKQKDEVLIASGGVNPELAESIAQSLGVQLADVTLERHGNGERYVKFNESVRGKDVFVVQSQAGVTREDPAKSYTIDEALIEHLFMVSAAAGSSARSVTAVTPYLINSRGDRKSKGREVVPGPLVIQFFEVAGQKTRFGMMSVDPHSQQTPEHLRTGPYDCLTAQPELRRTMVEVVGATALLNSKVVSPDAGAMKSNSRHARELTDMVRARSGVQSVNIEAIYMDKQRGLDDSTEITRSLGVHGVEGMICVSFDDLIGSGGTSATMASDLKEAGAEKVYVAATHAAITPDSAETLMNSDVDKVFLTNTLPLEALKKDMDEKLVEVDVSGLIGRCIYENAVGGSISNLFDDQNHL